jgi:long-subunit acyl-CoA synthetase (AMP-forming)
VILDGMEFFATYARLAKRSTALAAALSSKHGIEAGDRVAIFAPNWPAVARGDVEAPRRFATGRSSWRPSRNT